MIYSNIYVSTHVDSRFRWSKVITQTAEDAARSRDIKG